MLWAVSEFNTGFESRRLELEGPKACVTESGFISLSAGETHPKAMLAVRHFFRQVNAVLLLCFHSPECGFIDECRDCKERTQSKQKYLH